MRRPLEGWCRAPTPTWRGWNPTGTAWCQWRLKSHRLTRRPRETTPQTWRWPATDAIYGTVPEAEIIGAAAYLLHTPPAACTVHVVDASIIGAHLRRAQEALYRGIKGPTSHLVNQHAMSWRVEGLRRLSRRVGGPQHWVVGQSLHLVAVPLEAPDSAAARAMAPPVHLVLPKEHAILWVPGDNGGLEPRVPSCKSGR